MSVANIRSRFEDGELIFYNAADGVEIMRIKDGADGVVVTGTLTQTGTATFAGDLELSSGQNIKGQRFSAAYTPIAAAAINGAGVPFFIAPAPCKVISVQESHATPGATTATLDVVKCGSGIAPGSGTSLITAVFNISNNATADTVQSKNSTNSTGLSYLTTGDRLAVVGSVVTAYAGGTVIAHLEWL